MDRSQLANNPAVRDLVANLPDNEANAIMDLVGDLVAAAGSPTIRTQTRRDMGIPAQQFKLWNAYFSVIRFAATVTTGGGNTTVTWQGGTELRAFSYAINDPLTSAGFPPGFGPNALATPADTNIVSKSETVGGEQVYVHGISLMPGTTTDAGAFAWLNDNMSISIGQDGDARKFRLGRPFMCPASGGMYGFAGSVVTPAQMGAWSNGVPDIMNFYAFPQPLLWTASGETDSNLNVILKLERTVAITAVTSASTSPVNSGLDVGAYVDFVVRLHTTQVGQRSLNQ